MGYIHSPTLKPLHSWAKQSDKSQSRDAQRIMEFQSASNVKATDQVNTLFKQTTVVWKTCIATN